MSLRSWLRQQYCAYLTRTLSAIPDHIAVIQDGNRRYAESRGLDRSRGHTRGASTTESLLEWCLDIDITTVTLYTFSTENFNRPADERASLFDLITEKLYEFADAERVHENDVRIRGLGDLEQLPPRLYDAIMYAESRTEAHDGLRLNIALAYGGRQELLKAAQRIAESAAAGVQDVETITTETVESALYRESLPDVDLLIRTGGNQRTSNFLPWHGVGAAAAVYFADSYWPSFSRREFLQALHTYADRNCSFRRRRHKRRDAIARWMAMRNSSDKAHAVGEQAVKGDPSDIQAASDVVDGENAVEEAADHTPTVRNKAAHASRRRSSDGTVISDDEKLLSTTGDTTAVGDADD